MTTQKFSTIFFDWGGVIANDPGDDFLTQLLRSLGATEAQAREIFKLYLNQFMRGQISEPEFWDELRRNYRLTIPGTISEEFTKWSGLVANNDILDLAKEAKTRSYTIAVLSNVIEPTYNAIKQAGYYDLFDSVIASFQVGFAKPEIEIYQIALSRNAVTASECVFIDDKQSCLNPAKQLGMKTMLAESPSQIVRDVRALLNIT